MRFILLIKLILVSSTLFAGIVAPPKEIARTYRIGIIANQNSCARSIERRLSLEHYIVQSFDDTKNLRSLQKQEELDILIYADKTNISLIFENDRLQEFFIDDSCRNKYRILEEIYRLTKKINLRRIDLSDIKLSGISLYENQNYRDANTVLKEAIKKDTGDASIYFFLAKIASQIDRSSEYGYLQKAIELDPYNLSYKISLGNYYLRKEEYPSAIQEYSKCLDDPINSNIAAFNLGLVYEKLNNPSKAKYYYEMIPKENRLYGRAQKRAFLVESEEAEQAHPEEGRNESIKTEYPNQKFLWILIPILLAVFTVIIYLFLLRKRMPIVKSILSKDQQIAIKEKVSQGHIDEAFQQFKAYLKEEHFKYTKELALLENRWNSIKDEEMLDVKPVEYIRVEKNKVVKSFLEFIEKS